MKDLVLELKTKSGSMFIFESFYGNNGKTIEESWNYVDRKGRVYPLASAMYISPETKDEVLEMCKTLNRLKLFNQENIYKLLDYVRKKGFFNQKGGYVIYVPKGDKPDLRLGHEIIDYSKKIVSENYNNSSSKKSLENKIRDSGELDLVNIKDI
ncbi:MAG: hypothetical protein QXW97_02865 [Candidatus Pacearchaeota archaeon]